MWTARTGFIAQNRAALVDFLEDSVRAIRWYTDPKNHEEAVAIVARLNNAPPARVDWAFTGRDQYRDPNGMPNIGALQSNLQQQKAVGLLNDGYRREAVFRPEHDPGSGQTADMTATPQAGRATSR